MSNIITITNKTRSIKAKVNSLKKRGITHATLCIESTGGSILTTTMIVNTIKNSGINFNAICKL